MRLTTSGVFDRFPELKICIGHMGEAVHFWSWRLDKRYAHLEAAGVAPKLELTPSEYFKRNFVITTSSQESHLALACSIKALGAENILWAIDYPYQPTASAVAFMDAAPISEEERAKIYHGNAERVFKKAPDREAERSSFALDGLESEGPPGSVLDKIGGRGTGRSRLYRS